MPPKPMRLPPLENLKIKNARPKTSNPCLPMMSSVLGFSTAGCAALENSLRQCMDSPPSSRAPRSTINYHLDRMYDRVIPNVKPQNRKK